MRDVQATWIARVALLALVLSGCGGEDTPSAPPEPASPPATEPADDPEPEAVPVDPAAGAETPTAALADDLPAPVPAPVDNPGAQEEIPEPAAPPPVPLPALGKEQSAALTAARTASDEGDYQRAIVLLRDAEREHGEHPELRLASAWAHFAIAEKAFLEGGDKFYVKGYIADAQKRARETIAMHPDVPGAALLSAKVERYSENPARAREILEAHVEDHPDDADAHRELGDMAWSARDWSRADTHYTHVANASPEDGEARFRATYSKHWLQMPAKQIEAGYLEAARLLPDDDRPLKQLTRIYPTDTAKKLALLQAVIDENGKAVRARAWVAYLLRTEEPKDPARALEVLDEAIAIAPDAAPLHADRALALVETGRALDAVESLVDAVEKSEPGTMVAVSVELDRLLHRDPAVAPKILLPLRERAYDALCAGNPGEGSYGNNAGLWFRDFGQDYEKSLKYYLKSVEALPEDQDYLNDTGLIYLFHLRERKDESLPYFEKVLAQVQDVGLEPQRGYWDALENLCKYWFEKGQYEKVIEYANLRANSSARVNGRPYPSGKAAAWKQRAERRLRGEE